jgi:DNA-binding transcriptional ArsR family regulator
MFIKSTVANIEKLAQKLQALGDSNRLRILCLIFENKNFCVSDIAQKLNLDVALVSYHLQVLSKEKLLRPVRTGKIVCYKLAETEFINDLKKVICRYK